MIFRKIPFYVISRHGEKGYDLAAPYVNDRANLFALKKKGVEKIISVSAPGSLSSEIKPGSFLIPDDIIDRSNNPDRSFFQGRGVGVIRMNEPFCPSIRALISMELESNFNGALRKEGVYVCTAGPRLETRAEIRVYVHHGGSVVGMTLAPEVFLARELEICYAAICYPVNHAEGIAERPYQAGLLFEGLATEEELQAVEKIELAAPQLILNMIPKMEVLVRDCDCPNALRRYKKRGDLPEDFNDWFK
jgi:5'-methylthioadenosine phosphorylase